MNPAADESPQSPRRSLIPAGAWAILALLAWAMGIISIIDRTPYGLQESATRAVLLLWSIADQVASPIVTMGIPDFRAVYLIPAGLLFSGSLLAAKLCTLLLVIALALGLYRWRARAGNTEAALLASGLLLLAPLTTASIDHLLVGPFLITTLLLGAWVDEAYRSARVRFGGLYFGQLLLCMAAVTLHPGGLALPAAIALGWLRSPPPEPAVPAMVPGSERVHVLGGLGLATLIGLLLASGWLGITWLGSPLRALTQGLFAWQSESTSGDVLGLILGVLLLLGVALTLWLLRTQLAGDRLGLALALALLPAVFCADDSLAYLALVLLLYWGFALLLRVRLGQGGGFFGQRGLAFVLLLILSTVFLGSARGRYEQAQMGFALSEQDEVIAALAANVQKLPAVTLDAGPPADVHKASVGPRVASQWPGRTMMACRCSTLPLPPASEDQALFLANLKGLDYVVFDPKDPANRLLSRNFSIMNGASAETLSLESGGVVLRLHAAEIARPEPLPPITPGAIGG